MPPLDERKQYTYVLDTNVLLYDPSAMDVFEDNTLVIPITVIEEIVGDKRKVRIFAADRNKGD